MNAMAFGVDGKTFRSNCWAAVRDISHLSVIDFHQRLSHANRSHIVHMSVDGTDFRIREPSPFNPMWYSHKFNGAGLRYEVAVGLCDEGIVWVNGPFPCGSWPDLRIAREGLVNFLRLVRRSLQTLVIGVTYIF